jgi:N-acetylmuramoyl-L-alanine amidase
MQTPDLYGAIAPTPAYPTPGDNYATRQISDITDFIIHHSAGSVNQTPLDIDTEHRAKGMAFIAYNWVISAQGTIFQGRPIEWVSAASYGRNQQSVAVCVVGNFESGDSGYTGRPTNDQLDALNRLAVLSHIHIPSIARTIGHRDVASLFYPTDTAPYATACPGDQLWNLIPRVRSFITMNLHRGL